LISRRFDALQASLEHRYTLQSAWAGLGLVSGHLMLTGSVMPVAHQALIGVLLGSAIPVAREAIAVRRRLADLKLARLVDPDLWFSEHLTGNVAKEAIDEQFEQVATLQSFAIGEFTKVRGHMALGMAGLTLGYVAMLFCLAPWSLVPITLLFVISARLHQQSEKKDNAIRMALSIEK